LKRKTMTRPLHIVDVAEFYSPFGGGVKTYVEQKFLAAAAHGHRLTVIVPGTAYRVEPRTGGDIIWLPASKMPFDARYHLFTDAPAIWRQLDQLQPDIVEASSPWRGGWAATRWVSATAVPRILFMHADPLAVYAHQWFDRWAKIATIDKGFGWFVAYLRKLSAPCAATVVGGDWLAKRFIGLGLHNPVSIPLGVAESEFSPTAADAETRTKMLRSCGLSPDSTLLACIGRMHPEKRVPVLIDAVRQAQKTTSVGLFIMGDGLSRKTLERLAAQVPHVFMAGEIRDRPQVARMMASADALLHGSASETFGYSVAEALRSGLPIIVPDRGGAADFAGSDYAEVYETGNVVSATAAILRMIARDRTRTHQAAALAGQTRVSTADAHFEKLFALYGELAGKSHKLSSVSPVV
jgi:alpha-1,6-mannosyltransferase